MLTPHQSFRAGFLLRCAQEGLTDAQVDERLDLVKQAVSLQSLALTPLTLGAMGGVALGGIGGLMAQDADPLMPKKPPEVEGIQRAELAGQLRQSASEIRRQIEAIKRRRARPTARSPFGI